MNQFRLSFFGHENDIFTMIMIFENGKMQYAQSGVNRGHRRQSTDARSKEWRRKHAARNKIIDKSDHI